MACNSRMNSDNVPNSSESISSSEECPTVHYDVGDVDLERLKGLYPEFFDQDKSPAKGIEIYVWQMSAGSLNIPHSVEPGVRRMRATIPF